MICKQGEKLRRLISDLNLASRLEYAMQPLKKTLINPVELVRQCISDFLNNGLDPKVQSGTGYRQRYSITTDRRRSLASYTNA